MSAYLPTLKQLQYLVALKDHGHFGRAADACGIQFRILNASKGPAVQSSRACASWTHGGCSVQARTAGCWRAAATQPCGTRQAGRVCLFDGALLFCSSLLHQRRNLFCATLEPMPEPSVSVAFSSLRGRGGGG